jgi:predicted GNAT family N-acyltransferase
MIKSIMIKIITKLYAPDDLQEIMALRIVAWKESSLSIYPNPPIDYLDKCSVHFVAYEQGTVVASARVTALKRDMTDKISELARLFDYSDTPVLLSRLVTKPESRHRGIARRLTFERLDYIEKTGFSCDIFSYVRLSCAEYYNKAYGFEILEKTNEPYPDSCLIYLNKKNNLFQI